MHVSAGHSCPDVTGAAFALMAWARHRCLQLYFTIVTLFVVISILYLAVSFYILHLRLCVLQCTVTVYVTILTLFVVLATFYLVVPFYISHL